MKNLLGEINEMNQKDLAVIEKNWQSWLREHGKSLKTEEEKKAKKKEFFGAITPRVTPRIAYLYLDKNLRKAKIDKLKQEREKEVGKQCTFSPDMYKRSPMSPHQGQESQESLSDKKKTGLSATRLE